MEERRGKEGSREGKMREEDTDVSMSSYLQLLQLVFSVMREGGEGVGRLAGHPTGDRQLLCAMHCLIKQQIGIPVAYPHLWST